MGIPAIAKQYLEKVDCLSFKMQMIIKVKGLQTGSYVLGGYHEGESDIDVIFPPEVRLGLFDGAIAYQPNDYSNKDFLSFYAKTKTGTVYNLLFMFTTNEYFKWVTATTMMQQSIAEGGEYTDKKKRVAMFEKLKQEAFDKTQTGRPCDILYYPTNGSI